MALLANCQNCKYRVQWDWGHHFHSISLLAACACCSNHYFVLTHSTKKLKHPSFCQTLLSFPIESPFHFFPSCWLRKRRGQGFVPRKFFKFIWSSSLAVKWIRFSIQEPCIVHSAFFSFLLIKDLWLWCHCFDAFF